MNLSPEIQSQLNELTTTNIKEIETQFIERDKLTLSIIIDKSLINIPFLKLLTDYIILF